MVSKHSAGLLIVAPSHAPLGSHALPVCKDHPGGPSTLDGDLLDVPSEGDLPAELFQPPHERVDDGFGAADRVVQRGVPGVALLVHVGHLCGYGAVGWQPAENEALEIEHVAQEGVGDLGLVDEVGEGAVQRAHRIERPAVQDAALQKVGESPADGEGRKGVVPEVGEGERLRGGGEGRHDAAELAEFADGALAAEPQQRRLVRGLVVLALEEPLGEVSLPSVVLRARDLLAEEVEDLLERVVALGRRIDPREEARTAVEGVPAAIEAVRASARDGVALEEKDGEAVAGGDGGAAQTPDARSDDDDVGLLRDWGARRG